MSGARGVPSLLSSVRVEAKTETPLSTLFLSNWTGSTLTPSLQCMRLFQNLPAAPERGERTLPSGVFFSARDERHFEIVFVVDGLSRNI